MKKKSFNNTIFWYNFILCIFVILIHAKNDEKFIQAVFLGGIPVFNNLETFIVYYFAQTGVAGFFLCSGYLFYRNYGLKQMGSKYRSRISSVLIPYILWNLVYYLFNVIVCLIPQVKVLFPEKDASLSFRNAWNAIVNATYCPIFWYLQFLMIFIALSPLLFLLIKNRYIGLLVILGLLVMASTGTTVIKSDLLTSLGNWLFIYLTGGYIGTHLKDFIETKDMSPKIAMLTCIMTFVLSFFYKHTPSTFFNLIYFFSFVIALWCVLRILPLPEARDWQKNTFMVYVTHFMLIRALNTFISASITQSMWVGMLSFILAPFLCFAIVHYAKKICLRFCPLLWHTFSGSRS